MIIPLLLGLLGSLHCVAMCGPIALALPVHQFNTTKKTASILLYHLGRISVYVVLGVVFGTVGKGLFIAGFQQNVSIILGILLILGVLFFNEKKMQNLVLSPNSKAYIKFKNTFGTYIRKKTPVSFVIMGMLNGLLPCAMIYMALFGATATQGSLYGGLFMLWYGLGTIPLLSLLVLMGNWVTNNFKNKFKKAVPVFLIFTGCLLIIRGLNLDIPYLSPSSLQLFISGNPQCF
ncbi:sulfite exporter TauE/SafE family protein [Paenimyroides viscosum]|jgi:sulfite exporter TauE/SafE|uniref:Sulfite exporter TauE/SafE family protein n=1 Tax=Paenimyroides viscosum TaxID=2488729 RepID=A0A3P1B5H0_9FLAO|nr:sulfite exporter TauE/SafE family protein [Paenimyroides viscosum]RRA96189.1 sulfite exporter TauE/SafE family protein [Paenimyroides viscosum]